MVRRTLYLISTLLLVAAFMEAQTSAGRVTGAIHDGSGAVVPGTKIAAHSTETGILYPSVSNAEGRYVLYPLPPGTYSIT